MTMVGKAILILAPIILSYGACYSQKAKRKILQNFEQQEFCWNKKDTRCYCDAYANLDSVRIISNQGVLFGKDKIIEYYLKNWTPEKMGHLSFSQFRIEKLSSKYYFVTGRFHLDYQDKKRHSGTFSVIMVKVRNEWKIYTDHSS